MATFDELLDSLHSSVEDSGTTYIEITEKRQLVPTSDFDTIIAYEGDINSQVIYFKPWPSADGHDLTACENKELKWKNLSSKVEGTSSLVTETKSSATMLKWEVPSDLCTEAGNIEISLSFFDKKNSQVVYSWNTASYTGLSVGKTMDSVESAFPAKDEILIIDQESKNIIAPAGYNNVVCNYGDVGVSNVYFLVSRYLGRTRDLDILDPNTQTAIYIQINGYKRKQILSPISYTAQIDNREKEGMAFINWQVPAELTTSFGAHKMIIALEFIVKAEDESITKRWFSNVYDQLEIAPSVINIDIPEGDQPLDEVVYSLIDEYFKVNDVIWDPNQE